MEPGWFALKIDELCIINDESCIKMRNFAQKGERGMLNWSTWSVNHVSLTFTASV